MQLPPPLATILGSSKLDHPGLGYIATRLSVSFVELVLKTGIDLQCF